MSDLRKIIETTIKQYLFENLSSDISEKAMNMVLEPKLRDSHMLVVIDVDKFLKSNWYGVKPNYQFSPTILKNDDRFADKYSRAKDYIKKTPSSMIYAPYVVGITKDGFIYGLEGNHRFMVFYNYGIKKMTIAIPKNTKIDDYEWILGIK